MEDKKIKVLVCGTGFGKVYINSILKMPQYSVAGILGKGSGRSCKIAEDLGVPFFKNINDINIEVDCACVIVPNASGGGSGHEIAIELLKKDIPVLLEHPAHEKEISQCLKASGNNAFMLNPFYRHTPPVKRFFEAAKIISKSSKLVNASLECPIHVLYDGLDMLCYGLGKVAPWKIGSIAEIPESLSEPGGGNKVVGALIGDIPVTIKVNTEVDRDDPDHPLHLYHRLELTFSTGRLCLVNTNGPIVWLPFLTMPRDNDNSFNLREGIDKINIPLSTIIGPSEGTNMEEAFNEILIGGVEVALNKLILQTNLEKIKDAQFQIMISRLWSEVCQVIGYSQFVNYEEIKGVGSIHKELKEYFRN